MNRQIRPWKRRIKPWKDAPVISTLFNEKAHKYFGKKFEMDLKDFQQGLLRVRLNKGDAKKIAEDMHRKKLIEIRRRQRNSVVRFKWK